MDDIIQAKEWQRFAEMDLDSAIHLSSMHPAPVEIICYHCQQSAEKFLKAYLVLKGIDPPRIHDLDELRKACLRYASAFSGIADSCSDLTAYGVQPRYPLGLVLEEQDMKRALDNAQSVREFILTLVPEMKRP